MKLLICVLAVLFAGLRAQAFNSDSSLRILKARGQEVGRLDFATKSVTITNPNSRLILVALKNSPLSSPLIICDDSGERRCENPQEFSFKPLVSENGILMLKFLTPNAGGDEVTYTANFKVTKESSDD